MSSAAYPTGTLAKHGLHDVWLPAFADETRSAHHLEAMWLRRKNGPERHALWAGYYALKKAAEETAEHIRKRGGILFAWYGSAALQQGGAA